MYVYIYMFCANKTLQSPSSRHAAKCHKHLAWKSSADWRERPVKASILLGFGMCAPCPSRPLTPTPPPSTTTLLQLRLLLLLLLLLLLPLLSAAQQVFVTDAVRWNPGKLVQTFQRLGSTTRSKVVLSNTEHSPGVSQCFASSHSPCLFIDST